MPPPVITTVPWVGWVTAFTVLGPPSTSVSLANTLIAVAGSSSTTVLVSSTATGGSSTSVTVTVRAFSTDSPPESVARTRTDRVGVVSKSRETAVRSWLPATVNAPLSAEPAPATSVKVWGSPGSGSTAASVPTAVPAGWFSATEDGARLRSVGAWSCSTCSQCGLATSGGSAFAVSLPRPHRSLSFAVALSRPLRMSSPRPPPSTSLPAPPTSRSSPPPPFRMSSPPRPRILSSPPRPQITSSWLVPRSTSCPGVPTMVQSALAFSRSAWTSAWASAGVNGATSQAAVARARAAPILIRTRAPSCVAAPHGHATVSPRAGLGICPVGVISLGLCGQSSRSAVSSSVNSRDRIRKRGRSGPRARSRRRARHDVDGQVGVRPVAELLTRHPHRRPARGRPRRGRPSARRRRRSGSRPRGSTSASDPSQQPPDWWNISGPCYLAQARGAASAASSVTPTRATALRLDSATGRTGSEEAELLRGVRHQQVLGLLVVVEHHRVVLPADAGALVAAERRVRRVGVVAVRPDPAGLDVAPGAVRRVGVARPDAGAETVQGVVGDRDGVVVVVERRSPRRPGRRSPPGRSASCCCPRRSSAPRSSRRTGRRRGRRARRR